jgi:hypothetical protein
MISKIVIIVVNDSTLQSSESISSSSIDIGDTVNKKDERLELVEISKGLIEMLQNAGFTIEKILGNGPSHIAEILGRDVYVGEIYIMKQKKHLLIQILIFNKLNNHH